MAVFTKNRVVAVCLGALMLMATLDLSSAGSVYVGCFEPHQNCFPDDCQKTCVDNIPGNNLKEIFKGKRKKRSNRTKRKPSYGKGSMPSHVTKKEKW
uniref:Uncharacterized protein n=1 Tax=Aegilops tauschii TaxID=37682 RepID=M8C0D7_AEGTA